MTADVGFLINMCTAYDAHESDPTILRSRRCFSSTCGFAIRFPLLDQFLMLAGTCAVPVGQHRRGDSGQSGGGVGLTEACRVGGSPVEPPNPAARKPWTYAPTSRWPRGRVLQSVPVVSLPALLAGRGNDFPRTSATGRGHSSWARCGSKSNGSFRSLGLQRTICCSLAPMTAPFALSRTVCHRHCRLCGVGCGLGRMKCAGAASLRHVVKLQ